MKSLLKKAFLTITIILAIYFAVYYIVFGLYGSWFSTRHTTFYFNKDKNYCLTYFRESKLEKNLPKTVNFLYTIYKIPNTTWEITHARPCTLSENKTCQYYKEYFPNISRGFVGKRWTYKVMYKLSIINTETIVESIKNTSDL